MALDYSHMVWVESLIADLDCLTDDDRAKASVLADAHEKFKSFTPDQKSDVFLYLLGRLTG